MRIDLLGTFPCHTYILIVIASRHTPCYTTGAHWDSRASININFPIFTLNMVQMTISVQGGVVNDPLYL